MLPNAKNGTKGRLFCFEFSKHFTKNAINAKRQAKIDETKKPSIPKNSPCPVAYKTSAKPNVFFAEIRVIKNVEKAINPPKQPHTNDFS